MIVVLEEFNSKEVKVYEKAYKKTSPVNIYY